MVKDFRPFSVDEQKEIAQIAGALNIDEPNSIIRFASGAQNSISDISNRLLRRMNTDTAERSADIINELLKIFDELVDAGAPKGIARFLPGSFSRYEKRFDDMQNAIYSLAGELDIMRIELLKDNAIMEKLYIENLSELRRLEKYIAAGEAVIDYSKKEETQEKSGDIMAQNKAAERQIAISRLEKRLHNLHLSRTMAMQMAVQMGILKDNNTKIAEKINIILTQTLPLWQRQTALASGLDKQKTALESQRKANITAMEQMKQKTEEINQLAKSMQENKGDASLMEEANIKLKQAVEDAAKIQESLKESTKKTSDKIDSINRDIRI